MVPSGKRQSSRMTRTNTMELIAKLHQESGEDVASVHDQPKIQSIAKQTEASYTKIVGSTFEDDFGNFIPCKISDFLDVEKLPSPYRAQGVVGVGENIFVSNSETVLLDIVSHAKHETVSREFLRGGPRKMILHDPSKAKPAIVTCGGLCPGLNTVIREIYMCLKYTYGVREVYGVPFGFRGFYEPEYEIKPLTDEEVDDIHHDGGSYLGSSRGGHSTRMIVDAIVDFGFNMVFVIGGDGSHRGAIKVFDELRLRKLPYAVIGIPKTVDNDIALIDRSFGFATAVEEAQRAIKSAKTEATSYYNGIGLVKLMGRYSGHITMAATVASRDVDVCLIPEVPFVLGGERGVIAHIRKVLHRKGHCVVVVAEGAGMHIESEIKNETDASGNMKLPDVGLWLKDHITNSLRQDEVTLKYIDPTYMIRTVPANAADNLYCAMLAQNAVHGAFAGYTGFTVGLIRTHYVYIPMEVISQGRIEVDVESRSWEEVMLTTGQPNFEEAVPVSAAAT
mmetsp:Transcript_2651/g.11601  ORF Transcript_2651/g.11601 Transcript_2651/m.11601 type:complete len:506 (-) Transcript_2651:1765-3282(-)